MGITNEGRDIPVRLLAEEEGNGRFVVSPDQHPQGLRVRSCIAARATCSSCTMSDTKFTRLASVRYPRNGKPSFITDTAFAENDFQQQIAFWFRAMPGR